LAGREDDSIRQQLTGRFGKYLDRSRIRRAEVPALGGWSFPTDYRYIRTLPLRTRSSYNRTAPRLRNWSRSLCQSDRAQHWIQLQWAVVRWRQMLNVL